MTYPLPPISTVIGALHNACGYTEYHDMDVSILGKFASMHKEPYVDYCFLNSTMDDRGILVKMKNGSMLSTAYEKVASAVKSQGNSFLKGITIQVHNEELLDEYRNLKKLERRIAEWKKGKEKKYREKIKAYEEEYCKKPLSNYRTLVKSLKYYEILDDIELILHIHASEDILNDIFDNIYNLKALGRSEDIVDVQEVKMVELVQKAKTVSSPYSAYLRYVDLINEKIQTGEMQGREIAGTKYYLGKRYEVIDGKRLFPKKIKVIYTSYFGIDETSENVWLDPYQENGEETYYIVNFLMEDLESTDQIV